MISFDRHVCAHPNEDSTTLEAERALSKSRLPPDLETAVTKYSSSLVDLVLCHVEQRSLETSRLGKPRTNLVRWSQHGFEVRSSQNDHIGILAH